MKESSMQWNDIGRSTEVHRTIRISEFKKMSGSFS